jgi:hypothetical protein
MNRFSALVTGIAAVAVGVAFSAAPAMAKSSPVTLVTKHGIYKTIVTCPRWIGPGSGPALLMAAPNLPASAQDPHTPSNVPQPTYSPLVTCKVTFYKDAPAKLPSAKKTCAIHWHHHMYACCYKFTHHHGRRHRITAACLVLNTGFGGMAREVAHHTPAATAHSHTR